MVLMSTRACLGESLTVSKSPSKRPFFFSLSSTFSSMTGIAVDSVVLPDSGLSAILSERRREAAPANQLFPQKFEFRISNLWVRNRKTMHYTRHSPPLLPAYSHTLGGYMMSATREKKLAKLFKEKLAIPSLTSAAYPLLTRRRTREQHSVDSILLPKPRYQNGYFSADSSRISAVLRLATPQSHLPAMVAASRYSWTHPRLGWTSYSLDNARTDSYCLISLQISLPPPPRHSPRQNL